VSHPLLFLGMMFVAAAWIAWPGYAAAAFLVIGSGILDWVLFVFPCWVLLLGMDVLLDNLRRPPPASAGHGTC
jgi:hypothetical protein